MIKAIIPAALLLAFSVTAQAACTQADIAGTWTAYSISQDQTGRLAWTSCNMVIGQGGAFTSATSSCSASGVSVQVHGSLKLGSAARCLYSGSITSSEGATDPITSLTMSLDKQSVTGAGGRNGRANVFMFSMMKTK
jgi:hypothetical protein